MSAKTAIVRDKTCDHRDPKHCRYRDQRGGRTSRLNKHEESNNECQMIKDENKTLKKEIKVLTEKKKIIDPKLFQVSEKLKFEIY